MTHRRDLLEKADVIWYIKNEELLEVRTPQKLLNQKSSTSDLFAQDIKKIESNTYVVKTLLRQKLIALANNKAIETLPMRLNKLVEDNFSNPHH